MSGEKSGNNNGGNGAENVTFGMEYPSFEEFQKAREAQLAEAKAAEEAARKQREEAEKAGTVTELDWKYNKWLQTNAESKENQRDDAQYKADTDPEKMETNLNSATGKERTTSQFDQYPRQAGESREEYGARLKQNNERAREVEQAEAMSEAAEEEFVKNLMKGKELNLENVRELEKTIEGDIQNYRKEIIELQKEAGNYKKPSSNGNVLQAEMENNANQGKAGEIEREIAAHNAKIEELKQRLETVRKVEAKVLAGNQAEVKKEQEADAARIAEWTKQLTAIKGGMEKVSRPPKDADEFETLRWLDREREAIMNKYWADDGPRFGDKDFEALNDELEALYNEIYNAGNAAGNTAQQAGQQGANQDPGTAANPDPNAAANQDPNTANKKAKANKILKFERFRKGLKKGAARRVAAVIALFLVMTSTITGCGNKAKGTVDVPQDTAKAGVEQQVDGGGVMDEEETAGGEETTGGEEQPGVSLDELDDSAEDAIDLSLEKYINDGRTLEYADNGTGYNYEDYADFDNKTSKNAFGTSREQYFNDKEASINSILNDMAESPEKLAAHVVESGNTDILTACGWSEDEAKKISAEELECVLSWSPQGGDLQKAILAEYEKALRAEDTEFTFYYENDSEETYYMHSLNGTRNLEAMNSYNMVLGTSVSKRNHAPQLRITFKAGDEKSSYLDLNMNCGWQPNLDDDEPDPGTGAEGTGSENTGSEGTGSEDTGSEDTGSEGTGSENTGSEGTGSEDTGSEGTGNEGTGSEGTGSEDTGSEGTGSEDTGSEGTGSEDTGSEGTGTEGTGTESTGVESTGYEDTGTEGTGEETVPKNEEAEEANGGETHPQDQDRDITEEPNEDQNHPYNPDTNTYDYEPEEAAEELGYTSEGDTAVTEENGETQENPAENNGTVEGQDQANDFDADATVNTGATTIDNPEVTDDTGRTAQEMGEQADQTVTDADGNDVDASTLRF